MQAPLYGAVVDGTAARLIAVVLHRDRSRRRVRIGPPGDGLTLDVRAQILALEIAQFVVRVEVLRGQARSALQADDLHARLAELGGEDAACRAHADDDDVGFFGCHGSCPPRQPALACSPTMGSRVNGPLLCMSAAVNSSCPPGNPTKRQPAKSLLPP